MDVVDQTERSANRNQRTIDEIGREQGITSPQDLQSLIGAGADLWDSDEEFARFVKELEMAKGRRG